MSRTIIKKNFIPIYDREALVKYLSDMSEKGYIFLNFDVFDTIQKTKLLFNKSEKRRIFYSVDIFEGEANQNNGEYLSLCESAGWKYVSKCENVYVFCTNDENLTPLQTDPTIEIELLHKLKPSKIPVFCYLAITLILSYFVLYEFFTVLINNPMNFYSSNFTMFGLFSLIFFILPLLINKIAKIKRYNLIKKELTNKYSSPKNNYKKYITKQKINIIISSMFFVIQLIAFLMEGFSTPSNTEHKIPEDSNIVQLDKIIEINKVSERFSKYNKSVFVHVDEYSQENYIEKSLSNISTISFTTSSIHSYYYTFKYEWIAKDVYNRQKSYYDDISWINFTEQECGELKINEGKYFYLPEENTLCVILQNGKSYKEIYFHDLVDDDHNIIFIFSFLKGLN